MRLFALLLLGATSCLAVDFSGTWLAVVERPNGPASETVFTLQQQGDRLTGTMTGMAGETAIENGRVDGDSFSFEVVRRFGDNERRIGYNGRAVGKQIEITPTGGFGPPPGAGGPGPGARPAGGPRPGGSGPGPGGPGGPRRQGPMTARRLPSEEVQARAAAEAAKPKPILPERKALSDNGLARTPPMGWNSWNTFRTGVSDALVRETADAIVANGMKDAGYLYVIIDDGWQDKRNERGELQPNSKFPDMKALADYVHGKGLRLGIYSSPGPQTCGGFAGSYGYERQDAQMFADWGMDYLKYDWCSAGRYFKDSQMPVVYQLMGEALRAAGRPIVYALCQYGREEVGKWGAQAGGNLWRTTSDIRDSWESMSAIGFGQTGLQENAGPGHWNDPDMLEVGNGGMSPTEYSTHMTLWSMLAAPLLAGNDVRNMPAETREILINPEVIAVNQDSLGKQGYRVKQDGELEVWVKPLSGGAWAVALFNRSAKEQGMSVHWSDLKLSGPLQVRNLWLLQDQGQASTGFSAEVPSHGAVLLRVSR